MPSADYQRTIAIPNLISDCPFPLTLNPNLDSCTTATEAWIQSAGALSQKRLDAQAGLKCGLLACMVYPRANPSELQVACDFLNYVFHLDDLTDDMGTKDGRIVGNLVMDVLRDPVSWKAMFEQSEAPAIVRLAYDMWIRMILASSPGVQKRFVESWDLFFKGLHQQSKDRASGNIPSVDEYIALRRNTSGCKMAFVLTEYTAHLDLPDHVVEHPVIHSMTQGVNDIVTWSNVRLLYIYGYDREQARGDTHNIIAVAMKEKGLDVQGGFDFAGDMCKKSVEQFVYDCANLPSWGGEIDRAVAAYAKGLEDWVVGGAHWSFATERYFGTEGKRVMADHFWTLRPAVKQYPRELNAV